MTTIAAISTPHGVGGIAIVRLSGAASLDIAQRHCNATFEPRKACATLFRSRNEVVDEVVATYFPAPHSYTGEDMVEISCHGSLYVQQTILDSLLQDGAVMAEPGEFTQRAFLSGRLDLSQAEAVADLIDSTNGATHALALSQLRGGYSKRLADLRNQFLHLTSLLELELDFSDEDLQFADRNQLLDILHQISEQCQQLVDSFALGNAIKNGIPVAILGEPNAGKSTLLNALIGDDRAIVSDIPGTTRDTIEDTLTISGITFRFVDTAGLRNTSDQIEQAGIARTITAAQKASIILYLSPANTPASEVTAQLNKLAQHIDLSNKHLILLQTKTDLYSPIDLSTLTTPQIEKTIPISATQQASLSPLLSSLTAIAGATPTQQSVILTNQRHYNALKQILQILPTAEQSLRDGLPTDLVSVDLRDALYHLGTITGHISSTETLHSIFSRFCIGK